MTTAERRAMASGHVATVQNAVPSTLDEVAAERARQDARWGEQNHPDGTGGTRRQRSRELRRRLCQTRFAEGRGTWRDILLEEVAEAMAEAEPSKLRAELVQVSAVAAAWIEAIDRRASNDARA